MLCSRYRKMLMPYSEGALAQGDADHLRRHLASCARCSEELAAITVMAQALRGTEMPAIEPAGDLWSKIRGEIDNVPAARPVWRLRSFQTVSAGAVATLLFFVVMHNPGIPTKERGETGQLNERPLRVEKSSAKTVKPRAGFMDGHVKTSRLPAPTSERPADNIAQPSSVPSEPMPYPAAPDDRKKAKGDTIDSLTTQSGLPEGVRERSDKPRQSVQFYGQYDRSEAPQAFPSPAPPAVAYSRDQAEPSPTKDSAALDKKTQDGYAAGRVGAAASPTPAATYRSTGGTSHLEKVEAKEKGDGLSAPAKATKPIVVDDSSRMNLRYSGLREDLLRAREQYAAQVARSPGDVGAMSRLASVEGQLGNKAAALKWRRKLTELRPREGMRWVDLGRVYESILQPADAVRAYKKAISLGLTGNTEAEVRAKLQKLTVGPRTPANSSR